MAKRKQKDIYLQPEPKWAQLATCKTDEEQTNLYREMEYFVHYEIGDKKIQQATRNWLAKSSGFNKEVLSLLKKVPDVWFGTFGKACFIWEKTNIMPDNVREYLNKNLPLLIDKAEELIEKAEEAKDAKPKISIQQRMREQVEPLLGEWEGCLDRLILGELDIKKFDPYTEMRVFGGGVIKPNHAKIMKDDFIHSYAEALEVKEWADDEIKEAYSYMDIKLRKQFVEFYEKINTACDTFINTGKAARKTRKPKAVSRDKLVAKLKFQVNDSTLGIASINPAELIDTHEVWVYNTKTRKLGCYKAEAPGPGISVKGTTLTGFNEGQSIQKTLRKPAEQLTLFKGTARTKYNKAFDDIKTTDTKMNGRFNDTTIIIKAF